MTAGTEGRATAMITPVIMCGGAGTRLWPLSTAGRPKQLHPLSSDLTLLQETALRGSGEAEGLTFTAPIVVCSAKHADEIARQMNAVGVKPAVLVVEPVGRSTAPVAAAAARLVSERFPGALMLLLPADHVMPDPEGFRAVLAVAAPAAATRIVTLGVTPTAPEIGYGYIKQGPALGDDGAVFSVERFVEKPDRATAEGYLADGSYSWNAGIFLGSADLLLQELAAYSPDILRQTDLAILHGERNGDVLLLDAEAFAASPEDSIDYAVMEKTAHAAVVPMTTRWTDVGGWEALHALGPHDAEQNRTQGQVLAIDTTGSMIWATDRRVVVAGLSDILVVENEGMLLVMPLAMADGMRRIHKAAGAHPWGEPSTGDAKPPTEIQRLAGEMERWLVEDALPLWWTKGADHEKGGFHELLAMDGSSPAGERRARVQGRQTFVYADAMIRGRPCPGEVAVRQGLDYLYAKFLRPDGLMRSTVDANGAPTDETVTLYNQAFALFALSQAYAALGKPADLVEKAHALRRSIGSHLRARPGGFREAGEHEFQSNPHMHTFEAALDWEALDPDPAPWTALADEIAGLALTHFIDAEGGFLREFFDAEWRPAPGAAGEVVEPGHQFEWSWLLARWGRARGRKDAIDTARRMYLIGMDHGLDARGVAYDEMNTQLKPVRATARLWPQTEHLKAGLIFAELAETAQERARFEADAASGVRALQLYLDAPLKGTWKDKLSAEGDFTEEPAPASSFYHIVVAIDSLVDYAAGVS
ncbi:mannose-1-phosphate guanylyltransferase/mannose-6-phosphate isomerase [soil metagenome]